MGFSFTNLNEIFHFLKDSMSPLKKKIESFKKQNIRLRLVTEKLMTVLYQT